MVGQSMAKGRYVYYRCRRSYAGNFEKTCDSRYVRVENLEQVVMDQIVQVLSDPQRILEEAKRLYGQELDTARLEAVSRELRQIGEQQRRLADLYVKGSIPETILGAKSEELNQQRNRFEAERRAIGASRTPEINLEHLAATLPEATDRLRQWVLDASEDDMDLILRALQVQVAASQEQVRVEGSVPALIPEGEDLVTIVQTSGCLLSGAYSGMTPVSSPSPFLARTRICSASVRRAKSSPPAASISSPTHEMPLMSG